MDERITRLLQNRIFRLVLLIIGIYVTMKFLVPLFFPFIVAGFLAWLMLPLINYLNRKLKIGKGFLAAFLLITVGGVLLFLLWLLIERGLDFSKDFLCDLDLYKDAICCGMKDMAGYLEKRIGLDANFLETTAFENANNFVNHMQITYLPKIMDSSITYLSSAVKIFGTLFITLIATVFLIHDYDEILSVCKKSPFCVKAMSGLRRIIDMLVRYVKAQFLIFLVISTICILSLLLSRSSFAVLGGILTGFMDSLPFIGTGIILIPWSAIDLLKGNYISSIIKIATYLLCMIVREVMEPKLLGKKMGVFPIAMVMAVYVGLRIYGIFGVIMGPISLLLVVDWLKN